MAYLLDRSSLPSGGRGGSLFVFRTAVNPSLDAAGKLSVLLRSGIAQKAGGLPIPGKPRSAHAPSPVLHAPSNTFALRPPVRQERRSRSSVPVRVWGGDGSNRQA
jgi:hypothetical protein